MIAFLEGTVAAKGQGSACVDVGGVGYALSMSQSSVASLPPVGQRARVLCRMAVSDAGVSLYGFASEDERALFDELVQVSGVGPKTALAALSCLSPSQLVAAVAAQDAKAISKVPGIGKKSAERIILELKDKFQQEAALPEPAAGAQDPAPALESVREALRSMGFSAEEVEFACKGAEEGLSESELLQYALKRMG